MEGRVVFYTIYIRDGVLNVLLNPKPIQEFPQDIIVSTKSFIGFVVWFSRCGDYYHRFSY